MDIVIYIIAMIACGVASYKATGFLFARYVGEFIYYIAKNGKKYKVLRRPNELEKDAIARIREKVIKDGAI